MTDKSKQDIGPSERRYLEHMKMLAAKEAVKEARDKDSPLLMDAGGVYNFPVFRVSGEAYGFEDDCMDSPILTMLKDIKVYPAPGKEIGHHLAEINGIYRRIININNLLGDSSKPPDNALIIPAGYVVSGGKRKPIGPLGIVVHEYAGFLKFQPDEVMPAENFPEYSLPDYVIAIAGNDRVGARIIDLDVLLRMNFDPDYKRTEKREIKDKEYDLEGRF